MKTQIIDELSRKIGYHFNNLAWLKLGLTHRSYADDNNERLEFLGDSVVNFVIAEALFKRFPRAQEGELSRWRATLINRETLGKLGRELELGRYLLLGPGELKSGGSERQSILSCTMEALIGAIFLDGGFEVTRDCILRWYQPLLESFSNSTSHKDPKTQLQEYLQSRHQSLPGYNVDDIQGEAHQQIFTVSCEVNGIKTIGTGTSRRRAEQEAALAMLGKLK